MMKCKNRKTARKVQRFSIDSVRFFKILNYEQAYCESFLLLNILRFWKPANRAVTDIRSNIRNGAHTRGSFDFFNSSINAFFNSDSIAQTPASLKGYPDNTGHFEC